MNRLLRHRVPFYACLLVIALMLGYKAYLNFMLPDLEALHTRQVERIHAIVDEREAFSFAVVGNIENSVGIFERRIVPMLNDAGVDFVVSAGNAVSGGGEDKYRALEGTLSRLDMPWLLTFGENEYENFGSFRFYEHFGPHFYSLRVGGARLIFLDATGKTPWRWQLRWMDDLLEHDASRARFVFVGKPPLRPAREPMLATASDYLPDAARDALLDALERHRIDIVFSANLALHDEQRRGDTLFVTTGGAGGLVLNDDDSFYHYVRVDKHADGSVAHAVERLEVGQHPLLKRLESLWFFVYSLFYVGYVNFFLIVAALALVALKLHRAIFVGRDYYPDYDVDPTPWLERPLRVAMFTNNYLPFIGGVPISIARLKAGLAALGDAVLVVAPRYRKQPGREPDVLRVRSLLSVGEKREFRVANLFLPSIRRRVREFAPGIIHVHHPFWLGSLGVFVARRLDVPVIYTYHTRLEHYAHFVPLPGALFRNLISHSLIRRFANRCDGVVVPTYSTEEYLRMIGVTTPTLVQPTGIEYERLREADHDAVARLRRELGIGDERVLISVSRLSNEKNIDFLIDAVDRLRRVCDVPFRVLMIGDGHQRRRLRARIDGLGLRKQFTLVGAVPPEDMPNWYALGDVFVFASKSETQGMVILEAMAAGLPVVAVRSSGIDDVVRDGHNGFKTPENHARWCERVSELLTDDALRRTMADNAQAFAADHSVEAFATRIRGFYAETLAHRAKHDAAATPTTETSP